MANSATYLTFHHRPTDNPYDACARYPPQVSSRSLTMDGEKAQLQQRPDLEKGGLRVSECATQPLPVVQSFAGTTRTEKPRGRVRRLLVFLAIAGFVFHATTRIFKHARDGLSFREQKAEWNNQSHGMIDTFALRGKTQHGLYGKKAEELFLFAFLSLSLFLPSFTSKTLTICTS